MDEIDRVFDSAFGYMEDEDVEDASGSEQLNIVQVKRSQTKKGQPMWILEDEKKEAIFVFSNNIVKDPWIGSGYVTHFSMMEYGDIVTWRNTPLKVRVESDTMYPRVIHIEPIGNGAPDVLDAPDMEHLFRDSVSAFLSAFDNRNACFLSVATSGLHLPDAEIVQVAYRDSNDSGDVWYVSIDKPEMLITMSEGVCPSDIHGIFPSFEGLENALTFDDLHEEFYNGFGHRDWLVWNNHTVKMLDASCIKYGKPLIPRLSVTELSSMASAIFGNKWNPVKYRFDAVGIDDIWVLGLGAKAPKYRDAEITCRMMSSMLYELRNFTGEVQI